MKTKITIVVLALTTLGSFIYATKTQRDFETYRKANPIGQISVLSEDYTILDTGKPVFTLPRGTVIQDVTPSGSGDKMTFVIRLTAQVPGHSPLIPRELGWVDHYSILVKKD